MPDARPGRIWRFGHGLLCAGSLATLLGTQVAALSNFSHFQWHALLAWAAAFALFAALRRVRSAFHRPRRAALCGALCSLAHAALVGVLWLPESAPAPSASGGASAPAALEVVWFNMQHNDAALEQLERRLLADPPDLLGLGETNPRSAPLLLAGLDHVLHSRPAHVGLWSRFPIMEGRAHAVPGDRDLLEIGIEAAGRRLTVIAAHWRIPANASHYDAARTTAALAAERSDLLLIGDLNTTPWSPQLRALERVAGLRHARRGRGLLPTWAADPWHLMTLPIDHALVKGAPRVVHFATLEWTESDHRPLRLRLEF